MVSFLLMALAFGACPVEVEGSAPELSRAAWLDAARLLPELAPEVSDCARIHLELGEHGARLLYATSNGAEAVRTLESPDELAVTVRALAERAPRSEPAPLDHQRTVITPRLAADSEAYARLALERPAITHPLFSLLAGARGGANRLISPVLRGEIALSEAPWEIGVAAEWDVHHIDATGNDGPSVPAIAASIIAGARESVDEFVLLGGGKLTLAVNGPRGDERVASVADPKMVMLRDVEKGGHAEARLGGYGGVVWPRTGSVRLRAEFGLEFAPFGGAGEVRPVVAGQTPLTEEQPISPQWAVVLLFGAETGSP